MHAGKGVADDDLVAVSQYVVGTETEVREGSRIGVVKLPRPILSLQGAIRRVKNTVRGKQLANQRSSPQAEWPHGVRM